jgi:asparagine synthase (glutamine-hydrolysing)
MCGIAGFLDFRRRRSGEQLASLARTMADTMTYRGPDDSGAWSDERAGVAFGHRRLSIVDLSPAGHQPMVSASGRTVICYNGEVFNADELRPELEARGIRFRGHSDTEVILEGCEAWGVEACVKRLIGMFAFALWDSEALWLVRDRLGIKPLYWSRTPGAFLFGSELRSLRAHPDFSPAIDRSAVVGFLRFNYVPGPASIFAGTEHLRPGHWLRVSAAGEVRQGAFWSMAEIAARSGSRAPIEENEAVEQVDRLLHDAVRRRLVSDVPLGAFLSGGVDSSTVVALMQAHSATKVRTFTVGFDLGAYDESSHAAAVAAHLGTDHTSLRTDGAAARDLVPAIADWFDEPFADSSQIPTYLVSRLTRQHVTVALSGDGGDEVFAGYTRYLWTHDLWRTIRRLPSGVRQALAGGIRLLPAAAWNDLAKVIPARRRPPQLGERLYKVADILPAPTIDAVYDRLVSLWIDPKSGVVGAPSCPPAVDAAFVSDPTDRMQFLDTVGYLPDDILTKVDRTSMAVSLEARVPLLDHRLVELLWRLPPSLKIRNGQGKWLLRQVLYRYVPRQLIERPKQGFAAPIGDWLRGPLRDWAEGLLSEQRLRREGYLEPAPIRTLWQEHVSGRRNRQYQLWGPLMFQAWLDRWRPTP